MICKMFKDQRGSSVLFELAFLIPVLVMIFYGYTMFTNALAIDIALKTAAREGAREYAITNVANKGVQKAQTELSASRISGASVEPFTEGKARGIRVRKKYVITVPFAGTYGPTLEGVGIFIEEPMP